jgi:lysophospholipase L1-like esterase
LVAAFHHTMSLLANVAVMLLLLLLPCSTSSLIRVCCIGDSLTAGAVPSANRSHPYAFALTSVLSRAWRRHRVSAHVVGEGGAGVVVASPRSRLNLVQVSHALFVSSRHAPCNWTIVMAGINDLLAGGLPAERVLGGLQQVWGLATASHPAAQVIAVPPLPAPGFASLAGEAERVRLAGLVERAAAAAGRQQGGRVHAVLIEGIRPGWFDDGMHLTCGGYDQLGRQVGQAIVALVGGDRPQGTASPS